jgi:hypothetical protein
MNKTAILGSETYGKTVERIPLVEAGVLGGIGGVGGYYGGGLLAEQMLKLVMANKTPEERQELMRQMEEDGTLEQIRKMSAGAGALAGVGYAAHKGMDTNRGLSGMAESMVNPKYWEDPDVRRRLHAVDKARLQAAESSGYPGYGRGYSSGRTLGKQGSLSDSAVSVINDRLLETGIFNAPRIPISSSVDTINRDPFLTLPQKNISETIFSNTSAGDSGVTSGKSLMQSALQLGVGAGAGYLFGRAASVLFSMPPSVTKSLSNSGAIAGALVNSGIFSELL